MTRTLHWRPQGSPWAIVGVVLGLVAGIVLAAVAIPRRQGVEAVSSAESEIVQTGDELSAGSDLPAAPGEQPAESSPAAGGPAGAASGTAAGGPRTVGATATTVAAAGATPGAGAPRVTAPAANVRGVTPNKVRIGIAVVDLGAIAFLGPRFDNGNVEQQWEALIDDFRRRKLIPVNGRDVELVFRRYSVLSNDEQRASCVRLIQDDKVFAVVGVVFYQLGSECVSREYRTPLLTADGVPDEVYTRGRPFMFSLGMAEGRLLRNWMHWAHRRGLLKGKTIGVYYEDTAAIRASVNRNIKGELAKLGYRVAEEASTTNTLGGPDDALAVQRFRAAGVDLVMPLTSKMGFMQQAEAQNYKPTYIETDFLFGTSDTTTSTYPANQFDGTFGMTGRRIGETSAGMGMDADQRACIANYERYANRRIQTESTEWAYILTICDEGKVLLHGLRQAGTNLTPQTFLAGLETVSNMPMNRYGGVTFTRDKHHGSDTQRTVRWERGCACWKAIGAFSPLFVP